MSDPVKPKWAKVRIEMFPDYIGEKPISALFYTDLSQGDISMSKLCMLVGSRVASVNIANIDGDPWSPHD